MYRDVSLLDSSGDPDVSGLNSRRRVNSERSMAVSDSQFSATRNNRAVFINRGEKLMSRTVAVIRSLSSAVLVLACSSLLLAESLSNHAANDDLTQRVDSVFATCNKPNSPGCAVAVIKDGKIIYEHGYGLANLEYNIPITRPPSSLSRQPRNNLPEPASPS